MVPSAELAIELSFHIQVLLWFKDKSPDCSNQLPLLLVLLTVSELNWAKPAYSQFRSTSPFTVPGRFVPVPRTLQKQMREAKEAIEDSRYNEAVISLGELLARVTEEGRKVSCRLRISFSMRASHRFTARRSIRAIKIKFVT